MKVEWVHAEELFSQEEKPQQRQQRSMVPVVRVSELRKLILHAYELGKFRAEAERDELLASLPKEEEPR